MQALALIPTFPVLTMGFIMNRVFQLHSGISLHSINILSFIDFCVRLYVVLSSLAWGRAQGDKTSHNHVGNNTYL